MPRQKEIARKRRCIRVRSKVNGTEARPRLVVFRSLTHTYAKLMDDGKGITIVESSDLKSTEKGTKTEKAKKIGLDIAKKALEKKIESIVFDRNGYKYHGRVKAVAEGAREGGLKF